MNYDDILSKIDYILNQRKNNVDDCSHVTPKELTSKLKLESINNFNDSDFKLQNIVNTNFPRNTPCYIVGTKGSGKTYLLASITQYAFNKNQFRRLFYVYAENVDSTIARAIPRNKLYQIPHDVAPKFIMKYLAKKTKFCSCERFLKSIENVTIPETVEALTMNPIYWDNYLNDLIKRKHLNYSNLLIEYAKKTVDKYGSKQLIITIDNMSFNLDNITINDFDCFIIDDIAQFPDLFGSVRKSAPLYKYFTITRQNLTTFYLAGQELQQLPKMYRSQLGALVLLKGVDVIDCLREAKLPKLNVMNIYNKFITLKTHEGVLINYNTGEIEFIKS